MQTIQIIFQIFFQTVIILKAHQVHVSLLGVLPIFPPNKEGFGECEIKLEHVKPQRNDM